jgi:hypothetical protein
MIHHLEILEKASSFNKSICIILWQCPHTMQVFWQQADRIAFERMLFLNRLPCPIQCLTRLIRVQDWLPIKCNNGKEKCPSGKYRSAIIWRELNILVNIYFDTGKNSIGTF